MKRQLNRAMGLHAIAMTVFLAACTNSISEDIIEVSETPIRISSEFLCNNTRITDTNFENNDAIGLFVLTQPKTIEQERYISNERLTCPDLTNLEPDNELYYPKGDDVKCDFISYHPYDEAGIQAGSSVMNISIQPNQNEDDSYSLSDFVVATNKDITPSEKPVSLAFQHKLCKVQFVLKIVSTEKAEDILAVDPQIRLSGFHTQAVYDFNTNTFGSFSASNVLEPHGAWEIKEGNLLVGKEVILLPETLSENHRISITINKNSYNCQFPNDYSLGSGNQHTITLNYSSSDGLKADSFNYSITRWGDGKSGESSLEKNSNGININDLKFSQVKIYKIMSNGVQVAEISEEYLLSDNISEKAVVAYPCKDGKTDLSKGTVLKFPNSMNKLVGGTVSWSSENTLTYTPGSISSITNLYITPNQELAFSIPESPLQIWTERDVLTDIRGTEKIIYPIVKIGTQYWTTSNLNTEKYTNGTTIANLGTSVTEKPGFYTSIYLTKSVRFYNKAAIATGKLIPTGWKIPSKAEWEAVEKYLRKNASLMKTGIWSKSEPNDQGILYPSTNESGFNGYPMGFFSSSKDNKQILSGATQTSGYWVSGETENSVADNFVYLYCKGNEMLYNGKIYETANGSSTSRAIAIRFIRK